MRLANIRYQDRDMIVVAAANGRLVDINELEPFKDKPFSKMLDLIKSGPEAMRTLRAALTNEAIERSSEIPPNLVVWYAPMRRPARIYSVAMNRPAGNGHANGDADHPTFAPKPTWSVLGHLHPIRLRRHYGSVHPEPELAVVIWSTLDDASPTEALETVFGYTICNDVTSRGLHATGAGTTNGGHAESAATHNAMDTCTVMGPWLVTPDEVPNPDALAVACRVNGEAEPGQRANDYKVAEVLSYISHFHLLDAGDIVSFGRGNDPARTSGLLSVDLLKTAGPVRVEIDGLGALENPVIVDKTDLGNWRVAVH